MANTDVEKKVAANKQKIANLRKQLSDPTNIKSAAEQQVILDNIANLNREIEALTRKERKVVPVPNAPIYMNRSSFRKAGSKVGRSVAVSIGSL